MAKMTSMDRYAAMRNAKMKGGSKGSAQAMSDKRGLEKGPALNPKSDMKGAKPEMKKKLKNTGAKVAKTKKVPMKKGKKSPMTMAAAMGKETGVGSKKKPFRFG